MRKEWGRLLASVWDREEAQAAGFTILCSRVSFVFALKIKKTLHEITEVLQLRATPMLRSEPKGFVNVDTRFIYCKHFASVHLLYRVLCD